MSKGGEMTVEKLMKMALVVVVLVVVSFGVSNATVSGIGQVGGKMTETMSMLKFWDKSRDVVCYEEGVGDYTGGAEFLRAMGMVGKDVRIGRCGDVCNVSGGGMVPHRVVGGVFERFESGVWVKWDALFKGDIGEAKRDWELYRGGLDLFDSLDSNLPYLEFLYNKPSKKFILYGDGNGPGGDIVATWKNNEWTIIKGDNMLYVGDYVDYTRDDDKALDVFYKEVTKTLNDNVYWKVLGGEEVYDKVNDKGLPIGSISKVGNVEELYNGIVKAEHGLTFGMWIGSYSFWIRTEVEGSGSTAYGPAQLTLGLVRDYKEVDMWTEEEDDYLEEFIDQGCLFLLHGGGKCTLWERVGGKCSEDGIDLEMFYSSKCRKEYAELGITTDTPYDSKYDYEGSGHLTGDKDKILYERIVMKMLEKMSVGQSPDEVLFEWRFGENHVLREEEKKGYEKYVDRFNSAFGGNEKLENDAGLSDLKNVFESKKVGFLEELNPSQEDISKLKEMIGDEVIKVRADSFDVGIDNSVSPFVISFSSGGVAKYGMRYSSHGADKSELFFGSGGTVVLDQLPFILVEKKGSFWVEIGEESAYKLPSEHSLKVFDATLIYDFLTKEVCV